MTLQEITLERSMKIQSENKPLPKGLDLNPGNRFCAQSKVFADWWPWPDLSIRTVVLDHLYKSEKDAVIKMLWYDREVPERKMREAFLAQDTLHAALHAAKLSLLESAKEHNEHRNLPL